MGLTKPSGLDALVRARAFQRLLSTGAAVTPEDLARSLGMAAEHVGPPIQRLLDAGQIRIDDAGRIVGSAGLSVMTDRHRIAIEGRRFWTWCAYDIFGILGALQANGHAWTTSPAGGSQLELAFSKGCPQADDLVLVRPDDTFAACCTNAYEEWCPNSNLFEHESAAKSWMLEHCISGHVLSVREAAQLASEEWRPLLETSTS